MKEPSDEYLKTIKWNTDDRFAIEKAMVKAGGYQAVNGQSIGNGIVYHFKQAMSALMPWFEWHDWSHLIAEQFITANEIGIAGPASSGKTYTVSACAYTYIQIYPVNTSIIMSTTTNQALQLRIWGALKEIHNKTKEIRDWLPGRVMESRCSLAFEKLESEGQDFRHGIIGVACFLPGTLIETLDGNVPIESLKIGDWVKNASGIGRVTQTHVSNSDDIVRVTLSDGRFVDCTPEHPFFTNRGWVNAVDLLTFDKVFSPCETMRLMRQEPEGFVPEQKVLLGSVCKLSSPKTVRGVRENVLRLKAENRRQKHGKVLLQSVFGSVGFKKKASCFEDHSGELRPVRKANGKSAQEPKVLLGTVQEHSCSNAVQEMREIIHFDQGVAFKAEEFVLRSLLQAELDENAEAQDWIGSNGGRADCLEDVPGIHLEHALSEWDLSQKRVKELVQAGHCVSGHSVGCGNRRWSSPDTIQHGERRKANETVGETWVDRVEVLESRSIEKSKHGEGGHRVHNISVEGHPSYFANGILVHNCKVGGMWVGISNYVGLKNDRIVLIADEAHLMERGFLNAAANLRKGSKKSPFKMVAMGNPKDTSDALGTICEPRVEDGGWEAYDPAATTRVWKTRAAGGVAIQLCGYDTPNGKLKPGQEPYTGIITPKQIEDDAAYYGRESIEFTMMNLGIFPQNSIEKRVITTTLCESHMAFEEVVWETKEATRRVLGIDAAYSGVGGDRCVMTDLTWGMSKDGQLVMAYTVPPIIIPVNMKLKDQPEDQIALFIKEYAEREGIKPSQVGLDSTGKGTLVGALGRLWSPEVVPVEFGGLPTERIVQEKDQKTAKQAFGKFVTELWFASRAVIVGRQMRKLPREVAIEAATRAWDYTKGMKQDVEPKNETKARLGRSPDLWDSLVVAIEIARRNGFEIATMGPVGIVKRKPSPWMEQALKRAKAARHELIEV